MPVVVTGGDTALGREVLAALLADGAPSLRATVTSRAGQRELVPLGVRTAVLDPDDPEALAAVFMGAHTVVHLDGSVLPDALDAVLRRAGVRRLVLVGGDGTAGTATAPYAVVRVAGGSGAAARVVEADRRRD